MLAPLRLRPLLPPVRCFLYSAALTSCPWFSLPGPGLDDAPGFVVHYDAIISDYQKSGRSS
ncbi:MAG: hypothetical protein ACP5NN_11015 [Methanolinea sp.]